MRSSHTSLRGRSGDHRPVEPPTVVHPRPQTPRRCLRSSRRSGTVSTRPTARRTLRGCTPSTFPSDTIVISRSFYSQVLAHLRVPTRYTSYQRLSLQRLPKSTIGQDGHWRSLHLQYIPPDEGGIPGEAIESPPWNGERTRTEHHVRLTRTVSPTSISPVRRRRHYGRGPTDRLRRHPN